MEAVHYPDQQPTNADFAMWLNIVTKDINEEYPELLNWLENQPYYFETKIIFLLTGL